MITSPTSHIKPPFPLHIYCIRQAPGTNAPSNIYIWIDHTSDTHLQAMYKALPLGLSKGGSLLMRTGNNVIGGATWVMWARFIGLQKQKPEEQEIKGQKGKIQGKK